MNIREMREADYHAIEAIARELGHRPGGRGWFSPEAHEKMIPREIRVQRGFVAEDGGRVLGFITYTSYDNSPHITWIGVLPEFHRQGIGKALTERVESEMGSMGWSDLLVETPTEEEGKGSDYEATYGFYQGMGFKVHKVMRLGEPGFESDCDIAVLRKVLG